MVFGPFWRTTPPAIRVVVVAVVVVVILAMHRTPPLPTFWPLLLLLVLLGFSCWSRKNRWRSSRVQFGADSSGTAAHAPSADDWRRSVVVPAQPKHPANGRIFYDHVVVTLFPTHFAYDAKHSPTNCCLKEFSLSAYTCVISNTNGYGESDYELFLLCQWQRSRGPGESSSFSFENVFHWKIGSRKEPIK